jgi:DNA-binding transcriptional ArsR family regulator
MRKIQQALDEFRVYVDQISEENKEIEKKVGANLALNERQRRLLHYLMSDATAGTTAQSHAEFNDVTRQTAAKDLHALEETGYLRARREGKSIRYRASERLLEM